MSIKKIKELVGLMNDNDLVEVELEQEGLKVKLVKARQGAVEQFGINPQVVVRGPENLANNPLPQVPAKNNFMEITSPMVGTFYSAPSPEADAYVKVGDVIQKGDPVCIIEAMKLMNEVKAEFGGRIAEILVENAESVEFGQAIFRVDPL